MKIDIFSDLHLDSWTRYYKKLKDTSKEEIFSNFIEKNKKHNTVIYAGDSGNGYDWHLYVVDTLKKYYDNVISTPGNHDFYKNGDFLANHIIEYFIDGLHIISCPLWTNFRNKDGFAEIAQAQINDFRLISSLLGADTPWKVMQNECFKYMNFLANSRPDIVVTHFPIIKNSVHAKYEGNELNPYFCNDEKELFENINAKLWVHGHTHSFFNYNYNNTRVICNPIGYPGENYINLDEAKMTYFEL